MHHDHDDLHPAPAAGVPGRCSALRPSPEVVVIVLTGGASTRMGRHKPALEVGGRPIIERVVEAARPRRILVVGSDVGVPVGVTTVADVVPGGGPVSGLATGLAHLDHVTDAVGQRDHGDTGDQHGQQADPGPEVVVVLAGDLPFVTTTLVDALISGLDHGVDDGLETGPDSGRAAVAVARDADGRRNWLCAAWRREALIDRLAGLGDPAGKSMRQLADGLALTEVAHRGEAMDVDTPDDLAHARRLSVHNPYPSPADR